MKLIALACERCGAGLQIREDARQVACAHCGSAMRVERSGGTISLHLAEAIGAIRTGAAQTAAELALQRLEGELHGARRALRDNEEALSKAMRDVNNYTTEIMTLERKPGGSESWSSADADSKIAALTREIERKDDIQRGLQGCAFLLLAAVAAGFSGWLGWQWSSGFWSLIVTPLAFVLGGATVIGAMLALSRTGRESSERSHLESAQSVHKSLESYRQALTRSTSEVAEYTGNVTGWQAELRSIEGEIARNRAIVRGG